MPLITPERSGLITAALDGLVRRELGGPIEHGEILASEPGRHRVLALAVQGRPVVAKLFERVAAASELYRNLARLQAASLQRLVAPAPIACCPDRGIVLMSHVPGTPFGVRPARPALLAAAGALAELHALPLAPEDRITGMAEQIDELIRPHPLELAQAMPRWAETIMIALDALRTTPAPARPTLVHRDFHLRQLFDITALPSGPTPPGAGVVPGISAVGVVDWDLLCAGDPAFDVAYLVTYLETHGFDAGDGHAFVAAYCAASPHAVLPRLAAYRRFNLLRRACRRFRLRDRRWATELDAMLDALARDLR